MEKRVQLLDTLKFNPSRSIAEPLQIKWNLCVLCQKKDNKPLVHPKDGYEIIEKNILKFSEVDALPHKLNFNHINDGTGISQTLHKNNARWHKSCYLAYCPQKLERAIKRRNEDEGTDCASPVKTRRSIGPLPSSNKDICFFCEEPSTKKNKLIKAVTDNIDIQVRGYVKAIGDRKLETKLADGDMHAIDAMYHKNCLTKLANRSRSHKRKKKREKENIHYDSLVIAELVTYIEEVHQHPTIIPTIKLKSLKKIYKNRLAELEQIDVKEVKVHPGRLKTRLLKQLPGLRAEKKGKDILLMFSKDIGSTIQHAITGDMDDDAVILAKAAKIVRKEMFSKEYKFTGSFEENCERNAVSKSLLALTRMILEGPSITNQNNCNTKRDQISVTLTELLHFNAVKKSYSKDGIRHNTIRETPLPIYLSMLIHAKTRSKDLIDTLFNLGLCVSYNRLMDISTNLSNTVCSQYHANQVVCPPQLSKNVFTCGAVDNIDHNPSSTTAHDSFHGTAITLTQFPTIQFPGESQERVLTDAEKQSKLSPLPQKYTLVPSVTSTANPVVPTKCMSLTAEQSNNTDYIKNEWEWLSQLSRLVHKGSLDNNDNISWAAYHASNQPKTEIIPSTVALLPLFREKAQTTYMISHAMQMVVDATKHINPTQITILVADQPLYAIIKQVQWTWPETHGEDKIVAMMGGLHIEMNLLKLLGDWLRDSGWTAVLIQADITTSGRAEAMLSGSHVTRSRYAHQVTAGSLKIFRDHAYQQYQENEENALSFEEWCKKQ